MRILVVTGSSGGHIFPAVSLLESLRESDSSIELCLALPEKSVRNKIVPAWCRVEYLALSKPFRGLLASGLLLFKFRPKIVVGFGTVNSFWIVLLAPFFGARALIHEQNVIPGRANRVLAYFAQKIAVSFPETEPYLKRREKKIVLTGNPLRRQLKKIDKAKAQEFFGLSSGRFTVLVMGGSQGSRSINRYFLEALSRAPFKGPWQVIHIAGLKDYNLLYDNYKRLGVEFKLFPFLNEMEYAYSASDLVFSRAGATTIAELMFFKLAAVLIPYPFAYAHQFKNARVLERLGCAFVIDEGELSGEKLIGVFRELSGSADKLELMRSAYNKRPFFEADKLLREAVLSLDG